MSKHLALFAFACLALASCRSISQQSEVVKETYYHKYGVPVAKADWEQQGGNGQIVALRKDGVTVTTSYKKGIVEGPTTFTFPNSSTIQHVITVKDGELTSRRENYPSGVPMKEEIFEGNALVALTRWYEDGTPQATEAFCDSFLHSGEYRTPLNVVESRVTDGHGIRICRSNDGELLSKDTLQNGQMVERVTYFPNGDPATVTPYKHGVIHGTRLTFLQGGQPNTVEQWEHGVQDGITVVYQNGEKIAEVPYVDGKKHGTEYRYRDGTLLVEELCWKEDVKHGQRKLYVDGEIKSEWYHEGEIVSRAIYERLHGR